MPKRKAQSPPVRDDDDGDDDTTFFLDASMLFRLMKSSEPNKPTKESVAPKPSLEFHTISDELDINYSRGENEPTSPGARCRPLASSNLHHALRSLGPNQWLNDEVVNFVMERLVARDDTCGMIPSTVVEAVAGSLQPPHWVGNVAQQMESVQRCFIPVCHASHWVLFVRHASGSVQIYDSMRTSGVVDARMRVYFNRFLQAAFPKSAPVSPVGVSVPQQPNSSDCGLHVLRNADMLLRDYVDATEPEPPLESTALRLHYRAFFENES